MCAVAATHSILVNNVLLILVVVLNASTNVSASQAQNNLFYKKSLAFARFFVCYSFIMLRCVDKKNEAEFYLNSASFFLLQFYLISER